MFGRVIGIVLTLAIIGYLFYSFNKSEELVSKLENSSDKAALESAGVDTSRKDNVIDYSAKKAMEIKAFQEQGNELPTENADDQAPRNNQE